MKILITGGSGYIGSVFLDYILNPPKDESKDYLLSEDVEITIFDNLMYDQKNLLPLLSRPNVKFVYGDVRNTNLLLGLVANSDVVLPLACIVGWPACKKKTRQEVWATNAEHVIEIAKYCCLWEKDVKIIYPNTNSGYGIGENSEDGESIFCTEDMGMKPISDYGESKLHAEQTVLEGCSHLVTSLRLATVFGLSPRMRLDLLVNDFVSQAVTNGVITLFQSNYKRNYIHIRDIARTFVFAINNFDKMKGQAYNVGLSSANLSKMELCQKIKGYVPNLHIVNCEFGEDVDKRNYIVSNKKLEGLGWEPRYSLDDGIKELIKGMAIIKNIRNEWGNV